MHQSCITVYDTRATFDAATGANTDQDFNSTPLVSFIGSAFEVGDFSLLRTGSGLQGSVEVGSGFFNVDGSRQGRVDTLPGLDLIVTFDSPILAFGMNADEWNDSILRTTILLDGSIPVPVTVTAGGTQFFGFTSDTRSAISNRHGSS